VHHPPSKIRVRLPDEAYEKHRGKWIALTKDGARILDSASDLDALEDQLVAAGVDAESVLIDRVEDDDTFQGAAELH
jgi:hypothetical protein